LLVLVLCLVGFEVRKKALFAKGNMGFVVKNRVLGKKSVKIDAVTLDASNLSIFEKSGYLARARARARASTVGPGSPRNVGLPGPPLPLLERKGEGDPRGRS